MKLQTFTKMIDDAIGDHDAIGLLHTFYDNLDEAQDKEKYVLALIAHAVTSHQLLGFYLERGKR